MDLPVYSIKSSTYCKQQHNCNEVSNWIEFVPLLIISDFLVNPYLIHVKSVIAITLYQIDRLFILFHESERFYETLFTSIIFITDYGRRLYTCTNHA